MKIVTAVVNNVDFIEIQYHTLKKYVIGDYEFIVFNDAKDFPDSTNYGDVTIREKIENKCKELNIQCINIPNQHHKNNGNAAVRCANSMNFILNYQKNNIDKYLLLDSDMFLIDYFDINKYEKYDCAIVLQSRNNFKYNYFWNGIYYFDFTKLKNTELLDWNCGKYDVGGMMEEWLKKQIEEKDIPNCDEIRWTNKEFHTDTIYFIKHLWSTSWNETEIPENIKEKKELIEYLKNDPRNQNGKFFCEIYENVFLHYRAGGNWRNEGKDIHSFLTQNLKKILI